MPEGYNPDDEFIDDGEFDHVVEHTEPSARIPLQFNGVSLELTPANAAVRLFFGEDLDGYSRVIVYLDDGSSAPLKPPSDFCKPWYTAVSRWSCPTNRTKATRNSWMDTCASGTKTPTRS